MRAIIARALCRGMRTDSGRLVGNPDIGQKRACGKFLQPTAEFEEIRGGLQR